MKQNIPSSLKLYGLVALLSISCQPLSQDQEAVNQDSNKLFSSISSDYSGVDFVNTLVESIESNYYQYMYTYIGGGVAAGDINNDGLVDLFFTSNSQGNKLYLNLGDFKFEDITAKAGFEIPSGFHTGVTMVDINADGFLDIYICRGGWESENNKFNNLLYINDGDLAFTEQAAEYGLADANRSIQAIFFDYDKDQDLDVYVSNTPDITSRTQVLDLNEVHKDPKTLNLLGCDRLYNNDGSGHFNDVSQKAGLVYDIGFGLNPHVGDLNNDGWLDIYVCNDFNTPDLAYVNQGDGTFKESVAEVFKHVSFNSMGSDLADINNDGLIDLMTLDMNPEDYVRSKTTMAMTSVSEFEAMVQNGYHYQYMHNMLQLNNGNGTFSETSKLAGIANTDWSWSVLSADFDLSGFNDVFVTNGVFRDVIDRDKNNEILSILRANQRKPTPEDFFQFAQMLPQQKLNNYFFKNLGDYTFVDESQNWADTSLTFSNGASYADLDNDGDLDVIVNNINDPAMLLRNEVGSLTEGHFLQVALNGPNKNRFGIGTQVKVSLTKGGHMIRQLINSRGFLSSVSNVLHFGFSPSDQIDHLEIIWPDGKSQIVKGVEWDQKVIFEYSEARFSEDHIVAEDQMTIFQKQQASHQHIDHYFNDYDLQILLPHKLSQTGPALAKGDVNGDGIEDLYLGGGAGQAGQLLLNGHSGNLETLSTPAFEADRMFEDQGACFFDANQDGNLDLYVTSGSYEFYGNPRALLDRLYLGNGLGQFVASTDLIPELVTSGSVVTAADYDQDGDPDLFVGGRVRPGEYPHPPSNFLLKNEGGRFTNFTSDVAPDLATVGMVTDAQWSDIDQDGQLDLIVTGEWMGIEVFRQQHGQLVRDESFNLLREYKGWWNRISISDIDRDGDLDIVAGNLGLNYKFHTSFEKPFQIYASDFNYDGVEDVVLAKEYAGREVPVRGKTCMTQQMPHLAQKIPSFQTFAESNLSEIVGDLESALHYEVTEFRSGIFINSGSDKFTFKPFENRLQMAPINSIAIEDFDGDGQLDLLVAGNNFQSEVETTRADAGIGAFLRGNGRGGFEYVSHQKSGFFTNGDVRNMATIRVDGRRLIFVANNNGRQQVFLTAKPEM